MRTGSTMKRSLLIALSLLLVGGAALAGKNAPPAKKAPRAQAYYRYAWATNTCAPWDGAAMLLGIQAKPVTLDPKTKVPAIAYPTYVIHVWTGKPHLGAWIPLSQYSMDQGKGTITHCKANAQDCPAATGRVRFDAQSATELRGELRVSLEKRLQGGEESFPFTAKFYPVQQFCG